MRLKESIVRLVYNGKVMALLLGTMGARISYRGQASSIELGGLKLSSLNLFLVLSECDQLLLRKGPVRSLRLDACGLSEPADTWLERAEFCIVGQSGPCTL